MPLFTKRHYEFIASLLRKENQNTTVCGTAFISRIADALEQDNPKFNREKFITSCRNPKTECSVCVKNDEETFVLSLSEFLSLNDFGEEEENEIRRAIANAKVYIGGGGASPVFTVELA